MQEKEFILKKGIVRLPLLPFNKAAGIDTQKLREFASIPVIQESMVLASASFYEEVTKWLDREITDKKRIAHIEQTLYKYLSRASTRCTPFGVFSTTSYIEITQDNEESQVVVDESILIKSRLDTYSLQLLIDYFKLNKELQQVLKYTSNNTIYSLGNHWRYFETQKGSQDIYFELSKAAKNPYLDKVLSFCLSPKSLMEIKEFCFEDEFSNEEVMSFLDELIDAKILLSELEFKLTNPNPLEELITILEKRVEKIDLDKVLKEDVLVVKEISEILNDTIKPINEKYQQVTERFKTLEINTSLKDLLHIDSSRVTKEKINIKQSLLDELIEAKKILFKLTPPKIDRFKQFKSDFTRRYGERTMSLLHVLDPETGIGYSQKNEQGDNISLLNNIELPMTTSDSQNYSLTNIDLFLMNKILENQRNGNKEIELNLAELMSFPVSNSGSDTMSAFFTLLEGNNKISLNEFSGSTAIDLLNRFSYLDEKIDDLCLEIASYESECNKGSIVAEIIHLPELKSGNLLLSNSLRDYEIPCITSSEKSNEKTIPLADIQIRLINENKIELFSKKYGEPIIPKLSNALNYDRNSINVFRFLSDFQFQNEIPFVHFNWQGVNDFFDFFPRVNYKNIILSPAYWVVNKVELVNNKASNDFADKLIVWKKKRKIPNIFYLSTNITDDNKLYIDLTNETGIEVFKKELIKTDKVVLSEILTDNKTSFVDNSENYFNNEIILPLMRESLIKEKHTFTTNSRKEIVQGDFCPGSEWVSFKIYLGHKTADELIKQELYELVLQLHNDSIITKWFFVRYADEDFHLRVRFLLTSLEHFSIVVKEINATLKHYIENKIIHNFVIDTYKRELERYRPEYINYCESVFSFDSLAVGELLQYNDSEDNRWLYGAFGIDAYLNDFGFNLNDKVQILAFISNQYFIEFNGNKKLKLGLDKKYRSVRNIVIDCLDKGKGNKYNSLIKIIQNRSHINKADVQFIIAKLNDKASNSELVNVVLSVIHMFLNRLFISNPREQELVIYNILWKHYKSEQARMLKSAPNKQLQIN